LPDKKTSRNKIRHTPRHLLSGLRRKDLWHNLGLAALSALLLWSAFPPLDFGPVAWVALVPWLLAVRRARAGEAGFISFVAAFGLFLALLHWLRFVTVAGWFALAFYCALYWPLAACLLKRFQKAGLHYTFTLPLLLAALEFIRARFLTGFPFLLIAHTQYDFLPLIQVTDITGAYGVTFLLAMVNGLVADVISVGLRNRRTVRRIIVAGALLSLALIYGAAKLAAYEMTPLDLDERTPSRRILLVQGNVPIDLKHSDSQEQILANLARHARLSLAAVGKNVDLIIWPETMLPAQLNLAWDDEILLRAAAKPDLARFLELLKASRDTLESTLAETGSYMLIGSETLTLGEQPKRCNSAYLLSPEGNILGRYDKIHLVVFGEYTPFEKTFPFLKKLRPPQMGESLSAGKTRRLFELPKNGEPPAEFGVTICYEDSVAGLFRKFVNDGADFMVNITNADRKDNKGTHRARRPPP